MACPLSIQIENDTSGLHIYTGTYIIVLVFAVTVSIYYSALEMLPTHKIYTVCAIVTPNELSWGVLRPYPET